MPRPPPSSSGSVKEPEDDGGGNRLFGGDDHAVRRPAWEGYSLHCGESGIPQAPLMLCPGIDHPALSRECGEVDAVERGHDRAIALIVGHRVEDDHPTTLRKGLIRLAEQPRILL